MLTASPLVNNLTIAEYGAFVVFSRKQRDANMATRTSLRNDVILASLWYITRDCAYSHSEIRNAYENQSRDTLTGYVAYDITTQYC